MVLRRWIPGIEPIDFTPKEISVWLTLKVVPPTLITPKGVSWLASQVGQPINKYIRDGLDVKVCVIKDLSAETRTSLDIVLAGGERRTVVIEYPEPRSYKNKYISVWIAKAKASVSQSLVFASNDSVSGNFEKLELCGEDATESSHSKATMQMDQQALSGLSPKYVRVETDGVLVSDDEVVDEEFETEYNQTAQPENAETPSAAYSKGLTRVMGENGVHHIQKPSFVDFLGQGNMISLQGVTRRLRTRRR
ncbi:hypothetical protein LINPERPRIM_LOCUS782 [Linum perenne]